MPNQVTRTLLAAAAGTLLAAAPAVAQTGNGFLLGTPTGTLSIRGGYERANAGSDVFANATRFLTLNKNDFSGLAFAADVGIRLTDRFDFTIGSGVTGTQARSEDRQYVDNDDLPIEQTTKFIRVPITASVKAYLAPRGRSVGRLAWIPSRVAPYVGAGGGVLWYRYAQDGDFVDYETLNVFNTSYTSSRWTKEAHAMAGVDYSIGPRLALTGEVRYTWASAPLNDNFDGFRPIDLSGAAATAGLAVRF